MRLIRPPDIPFAEVTPEELYLRRREFLAATGAAALALACGPGRAGAERLRDTADPDEPTPYEDVTGYNNFYEFGT
ncbi:MAG TPA: mononuclear molybdenum enzyme YedY, partial [Gemmatimonadales bacterium]|nr:mononuclear molybdenum enzyme YedY [Gemmatimonadales bacterium]